MKVIKISLTLSPNTVLAAVEMSNWCKEHGLIFQKDYDYCIMTARKEAHFRFFNEHESMGSLFAMRWIK
jgi:hypothetical protein